MWRQSIEIYEDHFSGGYTWDQIRSRKVEVAVCSSVLFSKGVPSCVFIWWLAVQNRLSTRDKMKTWGLGRIVSCIERGKRLETTSVFCLPSLVFSLGQSG